MIRTPSGIARSIAAALLALTLVIVAAPSATASYFVQFPYVDSVHIGAASRFTFVDRSLDVLASYAANGTWTLVDLDTLAVTGTKPSLPSASAAALDEAHHRIFVGSDTASGQASGVPAISIVDLAGDAPQTTYTFPAYYPDQKVVALSYDAAHDRLYAITQETSIGSAAFGGGALVTLHALDASLVAKGLPAGVGDTDLTRSSLLWSYSLDGCGSIPVVKNPGFLGITTAGELYFFCTSLQVPYPENASAPSGVVVADVSAVKAGTNLVTGPRQADGVALEYFPIPGSLTNGAVVPAGDDRLMVANAVAAQQKLFVFDAAHRAWTGAIPLGAGNVAGAAADPVTGRGYIVQEPDKNINLVATEAGALPVPTGTFTLLRDGRGVPVSTTSSTLAVDPNRRRLLVPVGGDILVYDDLLPVALATQPDDPDLRTADVEEGDGVSVAYSGEGMAFGARVTEVNGYTGTPVGETLTIPQLQDLPRPAEGDRGSIFGWVELARLSGTETGSSDASADATRQTFDSSTASDLGNVPPQEDVEAQTRPSSCSSAREGAQDESNPGSTVSCDVEGAAVVASASTTGDDLAVSPFLVGVAESKVEVHRDPERGVVVSSTATARDIAITFPGAGALLIGEASTVAVAAAKGRPGTAASTTDVALHQVRIVGPDGETAYACDTCDPVAVTEAFNRYMPPRVRAFAPRVDADENVAGSPGGARAVVIEDPYAYVSDKNTNNDDFASVSALELVVYHDGAAASREFIQLASALAGTLYTVTAPPAVEAQDPASLTMKLADEAGDPLAGGVFELREDAGLPPVEDAGDVTETTLPGDGITTTTTTTEAGLSAEANETTTTTTTSTTTTVTDTTDTTDTTIGDGLDDALVPGGTCVTTDDGTGDCTFEDLVPGAYVITQTAAPPGYAVSDDIPVTLTSGMATTVEVTNVRSAATIEISLTDDHDPPVPLPGGEFAVIADDGDGLLGDADVELGRCTTGDDGSCSPFADVPLGAYVVHQTAAPAGLMPADDVAFTLDLPGQTAVLAFVNGAAPVAGAAGEAPAAPPAVDSPPSYGSVAITPPPPAPAPVITSTPIAPPSRSPLQRVLAAPNEMASFLARSPGESALFAGVWSLLLAPAYLLLRRRKLALVKEGL